jgi:heme/copper-type cytochrome/quinol oxidase subunit 4
VLLLFWVNGAVGIIGKAGNGINLIYTGVVAVGFIFAIIGRFEPNRMSRALFAMAFGQIMVALISIITSAGSKGPIWPWDIVLFTGFFTALWVVSALLFRISARNESSAPGRPDCLSVSSD